MGVFGNDLLDSDGFNGNKRDNDGRSNCGFGRDGYNDNNRNNERNE